MDNLIIYWIAVDYPNVSPGTCPAHLQTAAGIPCTKPFRECRAAQQLSCHKCWFARGCPDVSPCTHPVLVTGGHHGTKPAARGCPDVSPCTHPVLVTGGHHGTKPAGVSWVALHATVLYVQGSPTDFPAVYMYFVDWVLTSGCNCL